MFNTNKKWWILFSTGVMIVLVNLDMTIVNLALPKISSAFNATINQSQWIITSYLLATVLSFSIFGRLADMLGRKNIFLFGVILFTVGSLGAGLSSSISELMISRFVQGLGFAGTLGLAFVIVLANFPEKQRGFASGLGVGISGISQALGPTIGGLIVQYANWAWVFLINVPLGILSLLMVWQLVPKDVKQEFNKSIDLRNTLLFTIGLFSIFYAINQFELLSTKAIFVYILLGLIFLTAFYKASHKIVNPLINIALLKHKNFILLSIIRCLFMMLFSAYLFLVPLYLQNIRGFSAAHAGLIMLSMTGLVAIMSPITGKIMDRVGFTKPIIISLGLALVSIVISYFIQPSGHLSFLYAALAFLGLAVGLNIPATIAGVHKITPSKDAGSAMGVFFTLAITGAISGVALTGNLLSYLSLSFLKTHIASNYITSSLVRAASGSDNILALPSQWHSLAGSGFIYAYHSFMLIVFFIIVLALALSIRLNKRLSKETGSYQKQTRHLTSKLSRPESIN